MANTPTLYSMGLYHGFNAEEETIFSIPLINRKGDTMSSIKESATAANHDKPDPKKAKPKGPGLSKEEEIKEREDYLRGFGYTD